MLIPPAPRMPFAARFRAMSRVVLAGLMVVGLTEGIEPRPAEAGWGFKAWTGDPSEAPQLPLGSSGDASPGPDITLPPGYGAQKPPDPSPDAGTDAGAVPVQGYAAPPGTSFSFGPSVTSALTCETAASRCPMSVPRPAGARCYCSDAAGNRAYGTVN